MEDESHENIKLEDYLDPEYYKTPVIVEQNSIEFIQYDETMLEELARIYMNVFNMNNIKMKEIFSIGNGFWEEPLWTFDSATKIILDLYSDPFHTICVGRSPDGEQVIIGSSVYTEFSFDELVERYSKSFGFTSEDFPIDYLANRYFRIKETFKRLANFSNGDRVRGIAAEMNSAVEDMIRTKLNGSKVAVSSTTRNEKMKNSWEKQGSYIKPVTFKEDETNGWFQLRLIEERLNNSE